MVKTREHGAKVEPVGQRTKVELGDHHTEAEQITGRSREDPNHCMVPLKEVLRG